MKVKAKHWVKYNGEWHGTGETFSIDEADAEEMKQFADIVDDEPADTQESEHAEPVRRGRKRKTEE